VIRKLLATSYNIKSNQIKFICDKKEHNATQRKQGKYVNRTQRQYETALTSALQNKNKKKYGRFARLLHRFNIFY